MSLPSSGSIKLSDIRSEFNAPTSAKLTDFVRGGSYVPNVSANNGVPTSPPIKLTDFYGATSSSFTPRTGTTDIGSISSEQVGFVGSLEAAITFGSNAAITYIADSVENQIDDWGTPESAGVGSGYEIRATQTGGNTNPGNLDTWLSLSSDRSWSVSAAPLSGQTTIADAALTIEIRPTSGSVVGTYTLILTHSNDQED